MATRLKNLIVFFSIALFFSAITGNAQNTNNAPTFVRDVHSYSNPHAVRVTNVDLDWTVLFDKKT